MVHFGHAFHPVGHGTFFSGSVWRGQDPRHGGKFNGVYDCGSKRPTHLRGLLESFSCGEGVHELDLVCISHFDSDHVSGLELLLRKFRVKKLVLPYLSVDLRVRLALEVEEEGATDGRVAALLLDPTQYLERRGLGERYSEAVFVRGVSGDERPYDPVEEVVPDQNERPANDGDLAELASTYYSRSRASVIEHTRPWIVNSDYEIMFYNAALDGGVAGRSKAHLSDICTELQRIVDDFDMCSDGIPAPGWRAALRDCYDRHFGRTSTRRNAISLCALGRPLRIGPFEECNLFQRPGSGGDSWTRLVAIRQTYAVLLTGDLSLNKQELSRIKNHVGDRWSEVIVMQIPHHGSVESWEIGTACRCVHENSVICAPERKARSLHPNPMVIADLATRNPVIASYEEGVFFDYHG